MMTVTRILINMIPAALASIGLACSAYSHFYCESIAFYPARNAGIQGNGSPFPTLYFGPWLSQETVMTEISVGGGEVRIFVRDECVQLDPTIKIDPKWKTVRAFGIITLVIGVFKILPLWFTPCYGSSVFMHKGLACSFLFTMTLFQGLYFLWFSNGSACDPFTPLYGREGNTAVEDALLRRIYPNRCVIEDGSEAAIAATVLFFVAGIVMLMLGTPTRDESIGSRNQPAETQEVVYERTQNPDGTFSVQEARATTSTEDDKKDEIDS